MDDVLLAARAALSLAVVLSYLPGVVLLGAIAAGLIGRWNICRVLALLAIVDILVLVVLGALVGIGCYTYLSDSDASSRASILAMIVSEWMVVASFAMPAALVACPVWLYARRRLAAPPRATG